MKTSVFFTIIVAALSLNVNAINPNKNITLPSEGILSTLNHTTEENLEIAEWMLDESTFETEYEIMEVKNWMLNFDYVVESNIKVENWMLDETLFFNQEGIVEIEDWMLNETLFEEKNEVLTVEDWMLNVEAFELASQNS
ncbi:hypothetical protein [Marinilabilia sp.]